MMQNWDSMMETLSPMVAFLVAVVGVGALLWGSYWALIGRHGDLGNERKFPRQIILLGLTLVSLVTIILVLPISENSRNRLIGLLGLLISGILAFSSTTVVANLMAGILLRVTESFRIGDFIRVGDHFGRVSERGLFDTEIQSENREFIAIPNTYLISHPVRTIRGSGTIISTTLSLGYDIHHSAVEPLLVKAVTDCGLEDPFVHILELGNYAITYRVSGLLTEVKWFLTAHSNLRRAVLDALHGQNIEIVSPSYMNQRPVGGDTKIIPSVVPEEKEKKAIVAEGIVFDKAEEAEQIENEKEILNGEIKKLAASAKEASDEERQRIKAGIEEARERLKALEQKTDM